MQVYEVGNSVIQILNGHSPTNIVHTYCCTPEAPQDMTVAEAFSEMLAFLKDQSIEIESHDKEGFSATAKNKDVYTLATELIFENDAFTRVPTNILRYIFSQPFTINGLYIDENEEIIDLGQYGKADIANFTLRPLYSKFEDLVRLQPDVLYDVFNYRLNKGYGWHNRLEHVMSCYKSNVQITQKELFAKLFSGKLPNTLDIFGSYKKLNEYFTDICGLKIGAFFDNTIIKLNNDVEFEDRPLKKGIFAKEAKRRDNDIGHYARVLDIPPRPEFQLEE